MGDYETLRDAVRDLYYAAYWYPDRYCDAEDLWINVRNAAGFVPGRTASILGNPRAPTTRYRHLKASDGQKISEHYTHYTRRDGMSYLSVNRQQLITDLKQTVAEIRFQKKDGSTRIMNCTLMPQYLPEEDRQRAEEAANKDGNPDVLAVWDVDASGWRSFRLEWVYSVQQRDTI